MEFHRDSRSGLAPYLQIVEQVNALADLLCRAAERVQGNRDLTLVAIEGEVEVGVGIGIAGRQRGRFAPPAPVRGLRNRWYTRSQGRAG